jgi:pyrroline-5-carboxylate reductase
MSVLATKKIGFLGSGNMATALIGGLLKSYLVDAKGIIAGDVDPSRRDALVRQFHVHATPSNHEVVTKADVLVLAVKPNMVAKVLAEVGKAVRPDQLFISVCAGISTKFIESQITPGVPVLRVMPNTPALVGAGMSVLARGSHVDDAHLGMGKAILSAVGEVMELEEKHLDAVTAISGSGPAYFFYLMEAMEAAGLAEGLPPGVTMQLVKQTALGAARLADESPDSPIQLRRAIASPGGTTEAAINILDELKVSEYVVEAVRAAAKRSREMGK